MITTERVRDIMLSIDRGDFFTREDQNGNRYDFDPESYADGPQSINFNVVISAPHLHAHVLVSNISIFNQILTTFNLRNAYLMFWDLAQRCLT